MIDERTVEQARNTDMIAFLERRYGFTFTFKYGAYRCQQHQSLTVKEDRRSWYWHSKAIGGFGALDFLIIAECMPFREVVESVAGFAPAAVAPRREASPPTMAPRNGESPKALILPESRGIPLRLYDYLCVKRGIHSDIVDRLIQEKRIYEDKRGNVVFVGYDEHDKARFASLRGTYGDFRGDCSGSDKRYGFSTAANAQSKRLYLFESAIDLLSHASLANAEFGDRTAWEFDSRLSLAGKSDTAMPFFLNQHKSVKELIFCLDNDPPGREASGSLMKKYADKGYTAWIQYPHEKDFNEDLQAMMKHIRMEKTEQSRSKGEMSL